MKAMLLIAVSAFQTSAQAPADLEAGSSQRRFEVIKRDVTFQNGSVRLAGTVLLPVSGTPVPGAIFVHGAGRQTRNARMRHIAEHFAKQGIAAFVYDKRGVGESQGVYESHRPYENLVNDALAAFDCLRDQPETDADQIGIWGLSQGGEIASIAATRSDRIAFHVVVGAPATDGLGNFVYRRHLFRRHDLSDELLDVTFKAMLLQKDIGGLIADRELPQIAPREIIAPDEFVHHNWKYVRQPVLAIWGEHDQNVCAAESAAGFRNSMEHAGNNDWTIAIIPNATHSLERTRAAELQTEWRGHVPEAVTLMTDWVHDRVNGGTEYPGQSQTGEAAATRTLETARHYERQRWFGNLVVQTLLWPGFFVFWAWKLTAGIRSWKCTPGDNEPPVAYRRLSTLLAALNTFLLLAAAVLIFLLLDQLHPRCPGWMTYLPCLGCISTAGILCLIALELRFRRTTSAGYTSRQHLLSNVVISLLFLPFLLYWKLIGISF